MLRRSSVLICALIWIGLVGVAGQTCVAQQSLADVVCRRKADLLYPLATLIQPETGFAAGTETVFIGVLGKDTFVGVDPTTGRPVNHLNAMVTESNARTGSKKGKILLKQFASAKDYTPCHILFVSGLPDKDSVEKTPSDRLAAALAKTRGSPVLVVADTEGFAEKGSIINFYLEKDDEGTVTVKFEFNPDTARRSGFAQIDAGILERAVIATIWLLGVGRRMTGTLCLATGVIVCHAYWSLRIVRHRLD